MIKVGITEDNKYIRKGWETLIDFEDDLCVVTSNESCEDAFASEDFAKIDVLIQDISLPGMSGIEALPTIRAKYPHIHVIMVTVFDDDENIFEALKAGAIGYLLKSTDPAQLIEAIRDANKGGSPITPNIARKIIKTMHVPKVEPAEKLNEKELTILNELATGKSYAAIGKSLFLSVDGVRHHIRNIYRKLEVHSRTEAVTKGITNNLISPK